MLNIIALCRSPRFHELARMNIAYRAKRLDNKAVRVQCQIMTTSPDPNSTEIS